MNYECMTPILPLITIATKFLSKHCIKRVLDKEMNGYHCSVQFYRKNFVTSRSVDPKQPSHFHFVSQGEVHDLSGEVQNDLRGGAHLSTPPLKIRP